MKKIFFIFVMLFMVVSCTSDITYEKKVQITHDKIINYGFTPLYVGESAKNMRPHNIYDVKIKNGDIPFVLLNGKDTIYGFAKFKPDGTSSFIFQ